MQFQGQCQIPGLGSGSRIEAASAVRVYSETKAWTKITFWNCEDQGSHGLEIMDKILCGEISINYGNSSNWAGSRESQVSKYASIDLLVPQLGTSIYDRLSQTAICPFISVCKDWTPILGKLGSLLSPLHSPIDCLHHEAITFFSPFSTIWTIGNLCISAFLGGSLRIPEN